ncbi:MAG: tetratricopeptide repeat-containing sulfotransferase family protein [Gammaproteobacteria bacterium]
MASNRDAEAWLARALDCLAGNRPGEAEAAARHAIDLDASRADFHMVLGRALNNQQRLEEAVSALRAAVRLDPGNGPAHRYLGHVARRLGAFDAAAAAYREAARLAPTDALAHRGLGESLYAQGRYRAAMISLGQALTLAPDDTDARYNLALACHAEGELEEAVDAYLRVLARTPRHLDALTNLASAQRTLGQLDEAERAFRQALELAPRHAPALAGLAALLDLTGRAAEGLALLDAHPLDTQADADILLCRAELLSGSGRLQEAQASLEQLDARQDLSDQQRIVLDFSLAGILDRRGEHERAFERCTAANSARRARFDIDARRNVVDRLIASFSADAMSRLPRSQNDSELPVFIVGMPRSGTSLVEQILASHADVRGAGELRDIGRITKRLAERAGRAWPESVGLLDRRTLDEQASAHLSKLSRMGRDAIRVTDKMWQNFENLGLIELLFPRARVIHCRRHPLDTGLSCYFQSFALLGPEFSYDLAHIGAYHREYSRLMRHWREVSRVALLEVDYEALVEDPEGQSRRLIDFLGLAWDPACLDFHANPRVVRTASSRQVREPVYRRSVGRHRHYTKFLGPLQQALGDAAAQPVRAAS